MIPLLAGQVVPAHPVYYASYAVPVRQYRYLQSRLLQVTPRGEHPCGLLNIRNFVPLLQDFHLPASFSKKRTMFIIRGTHSAFVKARQTELSCAEFYNFAFVQGLGGQALKSVPSQMLLRCSVSLNTTKKTLCH